MRPFGKQFQCGLSFLHRHSLRSIAGGYVLRRHFQGRYVLWEGGFPEPRVVNSGGTLNSAAADSGAVFGLKWRRAPPVDRQRDLPQSLYDRGLPRTCGHWRRLQDFVGRRHHGQRRACACPANGP